ncbi:MAG: hypothetical protein IKW38_02790 [Kiritimatiellae bacterium]|nr:hypothetical protein [Kiritimatiellia bacterium]
MRLLTTVLFCLGSAVLFAAGPQQLRPVSVGMRFEALSYVLDEEIPVQLWVRNNTASTLTLGKGSLPAGVLDVYRVGDPQKRSLSLDRGGCLPRPLQLKPGEERTFRVDLSKAADVSSEGKYFVTFGVVVRDTRYETEIKVLEIVPGSLISEGVQIFAGKGYQQRNFKLVRWPRDHVDRIFLRIEDTPSGVVFPTVMLGAYLPLSKPRMNIAPSGEITILHRATPEYYVRNVFWSLEEEFVRRSTQNLLDPATADTARLNGMKADLEEVIDKNDRLKESLRLR